MLSTALKSAVLDDLVDELRTPDEDLKPFSCSAARATTVTHRPASLSTPAAWAARRNRLRRKFRQDWK